MKVIVGVLNKAEKMDALAAMTTAESLMESEMVPLAVASVQLAIALAVTLPTAFLVLVDMGMEVNQGAIQ